MASQPMSAAKTRILTAYRVGIGALVAGVGAGSLLGVGGAWWLAGVELVTGALVLFGIATRSVAFFGGVTVLIAGLAAPSAAVWPIHQGGAATALLFCALVLLSAYGSGYWTLGSLRESVVEAREVARLYAPPPDIEFIDA